jgi:hypothetical protein
LASESESGLLCGNLSDIRCPRVPTLGRAFSGRILNNLCIVSLPRSGEVCNLCVFLLHFSRRAFPPWSGPRSSIRRMGIWNLSTGSTARRCKSNCNSVPYRNRNSMCLIESLRRSQNSMRRNLFQTLHTYSLFRIHTLQTQRVLGPLDSNKRTLRLSLRTRGSHYILWAGPWW